MPLNSTTLARNKMASAPPSNERCIEFPLRLIAERPELKKAKPPKVCVARRKAAHDRKPKGFKATHPGQCVGVDTIEIQRHGLRRYISTFTDVHSRFALAVSSTNKACRGAKNGLGRWLT